VGVLLAVTVGALALLGAASCGGDDGEPRLEVLRTDPLTSVEVPAAIDERRTEREGNLGAKPVPAKVRRTFTVPDGEVEAVIDELAEVARSSGWELEPRDAIGFNGSREVGGLDSQLVIAAVPTERRVWLEIYTDDN
jgi:hypothetical protein